MNNANENPAIACCHLSKTYIDDKQTITVLKDINFSVDSADMVAIVGASGSGKSTFLQLLGGLDQPTSGEVFLQGQSLTTLNEKQKALLRNQYLGFVYQFHHLLPEFTALENVCIPLLMRSETPKQTREKALYYIDQVKLTNRQSHRVGELSGGERQRIAIARALVGEPKCILADEPTGNLDQKTADSIAELLLSLNQNLNMSFVIVTHNAHLAKQMKRILKLENAALAS